jgi:hypothetical protein
VVTDNGRSAAFFDGDYLNTAALSATGQATNFAVAHVDGGTGNRVIFFTPEIFAFRRLVEFAFYTQGAQVAYATSNLDDQNLHYFGADASQSFGAINGATITTSAVSADSQSKIAIGTQSSNDIPFYGYIQECIYYNSDQSSNRTDIEEDINSFYQIDGYTPTPKLIDLTQDLAVQNGGTTADGTPAAAYSLRLLSSTYTGPLVRIRRTIDNTEVDVYPDSDGEFSIYSTIQDGGTELTTGVTGGSTDKTTLHEFLYGQDTDCMVVRWYDQASGNHATQDVATSQPKIYDSGTGVVTENGKSAVQGASGSFLTYSAQTFSGDFAFIGVQTFKTNAAPYGGLSGNFGSVPLSGLRWRLGGTISVFTEPSTSEDTQYLAFANRASNDLEVTFQGVTLGTLSNSGTAVFSFLMAGNGAGSLTFGGTMQEVIFYASNQSTNRTGIESNINTYYSIYP